MRGLILLAVVAAVAIVVGIVWTRSLRRREQPEKVEYGSTTHTGIAHEPEWEKPEVHRMVPPSREPRVFVQRTEPVTMNRPRNPERGWAYRDRVDGQVYAYDPSHGWMTLLLFQQAYGTPPLGFTYVGDEQPQMSHHEYANGETQPAPTNVDDAPQHGHADGLSDGGANTQDYGGYGSSSSDSSSDGGFTGNYGSDYSAGSDSGSDGGSNYGGSYDSSSSDSGSGSSYDGGGSYDAGASDSGSY